VRTTAFRATHNPLFLSEQDLATDVHHGTAGAHHQEFAKAIQENLRKRGLLILNLRSLGSGSH
jgi:hypothetical protein